MGKDELPEDSGGELEAVGAGEEEAGEGGEPTQADFDSAEIAARASREAMARMSWRRRTATGAIMSGLAFGFQQVFEDKPKDISVIIETSGEPPTDLPVEAELEELSPRRSVVKIRPWLLRENQEPGNLSASRADKADADEAAAGSDGAEPED